MRTHVIRGPKRWLFCAATGLMLIQPDSVLAQVRTADATTAPSSARKGDPAAILKKAVQREFHGFYDRNAGMRPATATPKASPARSNAKAPAVTTAAATDEPGRIVQVADETTRPSAIEIELQKLYARDGRQMPSMDLDAGAAARRPAQMPAEIPQPVINEMGDPPQPPPTAGIPRREKRGGLLGRIFGRFSDPEPAPPVRQPPPRQPATRPAPAAPVAPVVKAPPAGPSGRTLATPPRVVTSPPAAQPVARPAATPPVVARPMVRQPAQPAAEPETEPALQLMLPPLPTANAEPETPAETKTANTLSDFPDPFTEMSEAEADSRRGSSSQPQERVAETADESAEPAEQPVAESPQEPEKNPFTGLKLSDEPVVTESEPAPVEPETPAVKFPTVPPKPWNLDEPEIVENDPEQGLLELPPLDEPAAPAPKTEPKAEPQVAEQEAPEFPGAEPEVVPAEPTKMAELKPVPTEPAQQPANDHAAKMRKIAEREGLRGFKGFCPVALRDNRDLVDALAAYNSMFEGKIYHFSSAEAKARFDAEPTKYAPVKGGKDVILLGNSGQEVEGSLEYAVWYKDRLHLFSSQETLETFVQTLNIANEGEE